MKLSELDLRSILALLLRQRKLLLLSALAVLVVSAAVIVSIRPVYTGSTLIMVDPSTKDLLNPDVSPAFQSGDGARVEGEALLVRADSVLTRVIQSEGLLEHPEFRPQPGMLARVLELLKLAKPASFTPEEELNAVLDKLRRSTSVERQGITFMLAVQVRSGDRELSASLANAIAQEYIAEQMAWKLNSLKASQDVLQQGVISARTGVARSEEEFDEFIRSNVERLSTVSGSLGIGEMQARLDQMVSERSAVSQRIQQAELLLSTSDWGALTDTLQSISLSELEATRERLQQDLTGQAGSPAAASLKAEIDVIDSRIRALGESEITALRTAVEQSRSDELALRNEIRTNVLDSTLPAEVLAQLYELQQGAAIARAQYESLLTRAVDLRTRSTLQLADSRIVSPATVPNQPSFPNRTAMFAVAALLALAAGIAIAFLYEYLIGGFTSEGQVESVLRLPVAATVPRKNAAMLPDTLIDEPLSAFAEAIRRIHLRLDRFIHPATGEPGGERPGGRVVMVTSGASNEGKTTLALSLARTFAIAGRSTLLIDCDLRRPSVHKYLELEPCTGLQRYLTTPSRDRLEIFYKDRKTKLSVIIGARDSSIPTDQLLAGPAFKTLIDAARASYDIVIVDTAPLGPIVDSLYIAPLVDAVLYVVQWAKSSQSESARIIKSLQQSLRSPGNITVVINNSVADAGKYGNYQY